MTVLQFSWLLSILCLWWHLSFLACNLPLRLLCSNIDKLQQISFKKLHVWFVFWYWSGSVDTKDPLTLHYARSFFGKSWKKCGEIFSRQSMFALRDMSTDDWFRALVTKDNLRQNLDPNWKHQRKNKIMGAQQKYKRAWLCCIFKTYEGRRSDNTSWCLCSRLSFHIPHSSTVH